MLRGHELRSKTTVEMKSYYFLGEQYAESLNSYSGNRNLVIREVIRLKGWSGNLLILVLRAEGSPRSDLYRSRPNILRGPYLVALLRIVSSISRNGAECVWKCELKKLMGET